ncbi:MAG: hypothetical protein A2086_03515 [Spirochaetes bacterium GWD1_27_9]|nr:MAG: hypothetical protein A2Z98_09825 [Spirochaetes bacterium GWB1_27_13]OHD25346.1 MAG: hypothetical protein A2Y34_00045 [Spirochaetes bacterium GWC1_27_15]OHD31124.1 MAG: hypothetical protein A2086_03515 [Spirochaetes bacterium GWD1_27_9]
MFFFIKSKKLHYFLIIILKLLTNQYIFCKLYCNYMKKILILLFLLLNLSFLIAYEEDEISDDYYSIFHSSFFLKQIKFGTISLLNFKYFSFGLANQLIFNSTAIRYKIYNYISDYSCLIDTLNSIVLRQKFGIVFTIKIPLKKT